MAFFGLIAHPSHQPVLGKDMSGTLLDWPLIEFPDSIFELHF
jgi:hypothetical protein